MADPVWLGYAGAITGGVGAVTGIAGSVLGYIAYRRSDQLKALDLRLELRKNVASLIADASELLPLLEYAQKSKLAVAAAMGMYKSGATEMWVSEYEVDKTTTTSLIEKLPNSVEEYAELLPTELESKIVEIHIQQDSVSRLRKKYEESLTKDDKARVQTVGAKVEK
jgi:hypothetical protein